MKPRQDITSRVKHHRLLHGGMTQQDLADRLGVTRQTIHAIEKGQYAPSVGLALRLAAVFGVLVEDLFLLEKETRDE